MKLGLLPSATDDGEEVLSGLKAFLGGTPHCRAAALCYNGTEAVRLGEKIWALPLGLVLS